MHRCHLFLLVATPLFLLSSSMLLAVDPDIELERHVIFEVGEKNGVYSLESEVKVWQTYLTDRSTSRTDFPIPEPFYGKVSNLSGKFSGGRLGKDNFSFVYVDQEDIFISNSKVHWIQFPNKIETGETVFYSYNIKYENAAWCPVQYVPNNGRVKKFLVQVEHPSDVNVDFNFFFPRDTIPYRVEHPDSKKTLLIFENVEEKDDIPYFPYNGFNAAIQIRMTKGGIAVNPTTPKEFTDWYRTLFDQKPPVAAAHSAKVETLLVGKTTPAEKLQALHDYVRGNIRYIADEASYGAIVPRDPSLVLDRGYGDCKDRAYLIASLARQYGIDVDMALVSTSPSAPFDNGVYVSEFNHAICAWHDGTKTLFFDPTSKYTKFGNLPAGSTESVALVLNPDNPKVVTIPRPNNDVGIEIDIKASLDDPEHGVAHIRLRNRYLSTALYGLAELRGVDLENLLSNMLTSHFQKLSLDYFEVDTVMDGEVVFHAEADLSDFLISSTAKKYVPGMPFRTVEADILERSDDPWGVWTDLQDMIVLNIRLDVGSYSFKPKDYSIGDKESALFSSSLSASEDGSALITYKFWQNTSLVDAKSKTQYIDFCKNLLKSKKEMFILTSSN